MPNYIYNGIELPELPEWDKEEYPYAHIYAWDSGKHAYLYAYAKQLKLSDSGTALQLDENRTQFLSMGATLRHNFINVEEPSFGEVSDVNAVIGTPVWSNYNIYTLDGALYLAASYPVPVEPEQPTLTARDLYRKINGKPTKLTLYKKLGGELVKVNEYTT